METLWQAQENNTTFIFWLLPRRIPIVCREKVRESEGGRRLQAPGFGKTSFQPESGTCAVSGFAEARRLEPNACSSMPSTHKKVIVRKMDRDSVSGYVSPTQFINEGKVEVLNTSGR